MGTSTNQISTRTNANNKGWNFAESDKCVIFKDLGCDYLSGNLCQTSTINWISNTSQILFNSNNQIFVVKVGSCNIGYAPETLKHAIFPRMLFNFRQPTSFAQQHCTVEGVVYLTSDGNTMQEGAVTSLTNYTAFGGNFSFAHSSMNVLTNSFELESKLLSGTVNIYLVLVINYVETPANASFYLVNQGIENSLYYYPSDKAIKYSDIPTL